MASKRSFMEEEREKDDHGAVKRSLFAQKKTVTGLFTTGN